MNTLPVDNLDVNTITLNGKTLIDNSGNLIYDGKILAQQNELTNLSVVSDLYERDLLTAKIGDFVKVTDLDTTYMFVTNWVEIQREQTKINTVSTIFERDLLIPNISDICNVTNENKTFLWTGTEWLSILGIHSITEIINDEIIGNNITWSSSKIDDIIKNHNHDGGSY